MKKQMQITLRSDLCAAMGKHFAANIDTDTALDGFGLPFIPSRRLKGCLREIAEMLFEDETVDALFGVSGNDIPGCLTLGDAHIGDYDTIVKTLQEGLVFPEKITGLYCSVRGQTAMEGEHIKDGSLRYTRVVNRDNPITGQPLVFYADIAFDDAYESDVSLLVQGLKNIGYRRNRGFGAVSCTVIPAKENGFDFPDVKFVDETDYEIRYTVLCEGDLMLPDTDSNHSLDYIPGTMVLGAMASAYTTTYGDRDFNDVFYRNDVIFGNLYPAIKTKKSYLSTVPVPGFLARIKAATEEEDGKRIYNLINKDKNDTRTYKPLKKGFLCKENGTVTEPARKIVYHNSKVKSDSEQLLYMQYCLCAGQYFSGSMQAKGKIAKKLYWLLKTGALRFGRSKTAQYGACRIVDCKVAPVANGTVQLKKGVSVAYLFRSDTVLCDVNGVNTVDPDEILHALSVESTELCEQTLLRGDIISGYNAKWNLKKPQCFAVKAGSCVIFTPQEDKSVPAVFRLGEKQNEGFGTLCTIPNVSLYEVKKMQDEKPVPTDENPFGLLIREKEILEECTERGIGYADKIRLEPSQVGRITLMVKDADGAEHGSLNDFENRIDSIKTKKIQKAAKNAFGRDALKKELEDILPSLDECAWKYIRQFLLTALTVKKYRLRTEGKDND